MFTPVSSLNLPTEGLSIPYGARGVKIQGFLAGKRAYERRSMGLRGCGLVAFLGHKRVRFAASCTPKRLKLLILLTLAHDS